MRTFDAFLEEQLRDPEFRAEYEALEPDYAIAQAIVASGMTEKELSEKAGITKGYLRKIEFADANPSLKTLKSLAAGMNMKLKLEFLPMEDQRVGG